MHPAHIKQHQDSANQYKFPLGKQLKRNQSILVCTYGNSAGNLVLINLSDWNPN